MGQELQALNQPQIKALVAATPTKKRPALAKALKAACQHLRDSRKDYNQAFKLAEAMVENWWHLGVELKKIDFDKGGRPSKKTGPPGDRFNLSDIGINKNLSARCQRLADMEKCDLDDWLESQYDEVMYYLPSLKAAIQPHVANNSGNNEWYTPERYIVAARTVMGGIDLDPATSKLAQKIVKAKKFYTADDDGLSDDKRWKGRVWMNPPYASDLVGKFTAKLARHYEAGDVKAACVLVNNATDARWFQHLAALSSAACFPLGRIRFIDEAGEPSGAPLQGQSVIYLGAAAENFVREFSVFGLVLENAHEMVEG